MKLVGRRLCLGGLGLGLMLGLSGCGAVSVGFTAVGVDENGAPVAHVVVCDEHLDSVILLSDRDQQVMGKLKATSPVTSTASVSLAAPGQGWTVDRPLRELQDGVEYSLSGGAASAGLNSSEVTFSTADLAKLKSGQVFLQDWKDTGGAEYVATDVVRDLADFQAHACDNREDAGGWF